MNLQNCVFAIYFVLLLTGCSHPQFPVTDHSDGKIFYNEDRTAGAPKGLFQALKWKLTSDVKDWPEQKDDNEKPDFLKKIGANEAAVTFINHATELIQLEKLTVITDPIFAERASPFSWIGSKRHRKPGAEIFELPKIDVVVISHNHYDHLNIESLIELQKKDQPQFIVPLGTKALLEESGIKNVTELDWWQNFKTEQGAVITLVPMQHWSARGVFDRFEALWGGYLIESSGLKIIFAGDTGYNNQFKEIQQKVGSIDISILPIGAYEPRWFMKGQHMNPFEAVQAHRDLQSKLSIGTHFGTFQLTDEGIDDPITDLESELQTAKIELKYFVAPKNGQTIFFTK
ncbi:MAG: MBL fold metallo-hydrolase [Bdellovibrio sp.]|nr:MBL fold metallo-hydrolase [Bdellovibrio sp.]